MSRYGNVLNTVGGMHAPVVAYPREIRFIDVPKPTGCADNPASGSANNFLARLF